ncbi:hypothetical protein GBAR_LOCUS4792 [Geodia barretti]|uniref:Uncharacterized protein n=1 Tax=Geodia barretti TaxID=519541 RepID=A0AA35R823_GEOBA|nr:hypothetical protein GBAR_LOCUS4792 [Geodia barretti]
MANWEALVKWSLKYHDGTRSEPRMDDEVGSLASMIAYYLQPMAHRGFSAYNVCKSLLMSVPQRRRWLQEALQAVASAPTESQLLQAALTVVRAHSPAGGDVGEEEGEEEEEHLLRTFEEIQYPH